MVTQNFILEKMDSLNIKFLFLKYQKIRIPFINDFPVEKCKKCKNILCLNNLYYIAKEKDVEMYCENCKSENDSIVEFSFTQNNSLKNEEIIDKLNSYLKKNKDTSKPEYNEIMLSFISFTNMIILLLEQFESKDAFHNQVILFQNYIDNVSIYYM